MNPSMVDKAVQYAIKKTMLRAADMCETITDRDVEEMRYQLHATGSTLEQLTRVDRLMVAVAHLRACAEGKPWKP